MTQDDKALDDLEKEITEKAALQWADLQILALSAFLSAGRSEIVQLLEEEDFPTETFRKIFVALRDHWRMFKNTDIFEIHHSIAGQPWYESIGGLQYMINALVTPRTGSWHAGDINRLIEMIKEMRAHRELGNMQSLLEVSSPGQIGETLAILKAKARRAEEILPRSTNLSIKEMAKDLKRDPEPKIPTGFDRMDAALDGGMRKGALFCIAARPGVGKTTLALNVAMNAAQRNKRVMFISLEMSREEIAERYLAAYADTTPEKARKEADTILPAIDGDLLIDDTTRTVDGLKSIIMRNSDCDLFIVDYLQLMSAPSHGSHGRSRIQEISYMTMEIKVLARDIEKPIILVCQMSRAIERERANREPVLADLRESGTIEQDCDYVSFLWNKNAKEKEKNDDALDIFQLDDDDGERHAPPDIRWILRKNRFGQPDRSFQMDFYGPHYTFTHRPLGNQSKKNPEQSSTGL